jgi:hypothetical protein
VNRLLMLAIVVAVVVCSMGAVAAAQTSPGGSGQAAPTAAAAKPVPAELPEVLARVNGEAINKGDFEKAVKSIEQRAGGPIPADQRDSDLSRGPRTAGGVQAPDAGEQDAPRGCA